MPDHDPINYPHHYTASAAKCATCAAPIECIQITETMGFVLGNAVKYIWRADLKGGAEDLKKARWYLDREIRRRERAATAMADHPIPIEQGTGTLADAWHSTAND